MFKSGSSCCSSCHKKVLPERGNPATQKSPSVPSTSRFRFHRPIGWKRWGLRQTIRRANRLMGASNLGHIRRNKFAQASQTARAKCMPQNIVHFPRTARVLLSICWSYSRHTVILEPQKDIVFEWCNKNLVPPTHESRKILCQPSVYRAFRFVKGVAIAFPLSLGQFKVAWHVTLLT